MKEIKIQGKKYPVVANMQTILNYEEISGNNFFTENFDTLKKRMAIILAAALAADSETELTVEKLKGEGKDIKINNGNIDNNNEDFDGEDNVSLTVLT